MDTSDIEKRVKSMKEVGGYIELDTYQLPMWHENAIGLNCGRNALAYLFKSRSIRKIRLPIFICSSIPDVCEREGIKKRFYSINSNFRPQDNLVLDEDEWLYIVNYYGQISNEELKEYVHKYNRVIIDQANGYFEKPLAGVDTIYTCRKWFGVPDGAFLYTDSLLSEELPIDESFNRMSFLLGRYERTANEFYREYTENNRYFANEPIKRMSKLTRNLLHGIDYDFVKQRRQENFEYLNEQLKHINQLNVNTATFMYPLMIENGAKIRKQLQAKYIYVPILWPGVFEYTSPEELEYRMALNILPLPIDQRYSLDDMDYIVKEVLQCIN